MKYLVVCMLALLVLIGCAQNAMPEQVAVDTLPDAQVDVTQDVAQIESDLEEINSLESDVDFSDLDSLEQDLDLGI